MTGTPATILAHGVGTVYESPIPLSLYVLGAAATVLVSFAIRAFSSSEPGPFTTRRLAGGGVARLLSTLLKWGGFALLLVMLVSGVMVRDEGLSLTVLLFWVGLVVGTVAGSTVLAGTWDAADPWRTAEELYRVEGSSEDAVREPPAWLGPALIYLLFWFELVSGVGFEDVWVVLALLLYTLYSLAFRAQFGERWREADPFAVLFGFAARIAPLRLLPDAVEARSPLAGLDEDRPMPAGLYAAIFVLLGATTLDNMRETVGWTSFVRATGLDAIPTMLLDSVALGMFALLFLVPFLAAVALAGRWTSRESSFIGVARRFGWSLIPIGIAYVLAHNAPLLMAGIPALARTAADPLGLGWDLAGLSGSFSGFIPSPRAVWFIEIAIIVGGHILGVLAAHRIAYRLGAGHRAAVRGQYALTALMTVYTVATLWLLAQPLVA